MRSLCLAHSSIQFVDRQGRIPCPVGMPGLLLVLVFQLFFLLQLILLALLALLFQFLFQLLLFLLALYASLFLLLFLFLQILLALFALLFLLVLLRFLFLAHGGFLFENEAGQFFSIGF
jgi:hypothetical protein